MFLGLVALCLPRFCAHKSLASIALLGVIRICKGVHLMTVFYAILGMKVTIGSLSAVTSCILWQDVKLLLLYSAVYSPWTRWQSLCSSPTYMSVREHFLDFSVKNSAMLQYLHDYPFTLISHYGSLYSVIILHQLRALRQCRVNNISWALKLQICLMIKQHLMFTWKVMLPASYLV